METRGPTTTVRNTDSGQWLVELTDFIGKDGVNTISLNLLMPRSDDALVALHAKLIDRAIEMLQDYRKHLPPG